MNDVVTDNSIHTDVEMENNQVADEGLSQEGSSSDEDGLVQNQKVPARKQRLYNQKQVDRLLAQKIERERRRVTKEHNSAQHADNAPYDNGSHSSIDQLVEDKLKNLMAQREKKAVEQDLAHRQALYQQKLGNARKKYDDFESVMGSANMITAPTTEAIISATEYMDSPGEFIYELCKNHPEKLEKLEKLKSPWAQAKYIGQLESSLSSKIKTVSGAPSPMQKEKQVAHGSSSNMSPEERHRQRIKKMRDS